MKRIHVLDQSVAELIAAGEVVERPASVVKELLENAIDAGATKITVEIKGGGIGYIRVTDNGAGIHADDLPNAFLRHATSKVREEKDLEAIATLGFRGEALASIAAVAKVSVTTKTSESTDGWFYEIHGGSALEIPHTIASVNGTTFTVRDVFFNTPARMKFLRRDITEGNSIAQIIDKCALSHPDIAICFIRDMKTRLQTSGNSDLLSVIAAVYGREFSQEMLAIDYSFENRITVKGYVGLPGNTKPNRTYQNYYINGRYVQARTCSVALEEAFKGKIMTGHFPVAVLFVDLEPTLVDVNVHPAKIEVRFSDEKAIFNAVFYAVRGALQKTETFIGQPRPETKPSVFDLKTPVEAPKQEHLPPQLTIPVYHEEEDSSFTKELSFSAPKTASVRGNTAAGIYQKPDNYSHFISSTPIAQIESPLAPEMLPETEDFLPAEPQTAKCELRLIGELFRTYILLESSENELFLVDKHAAHERLKYEDLLEHTKSGQRQLLLTAVPITLQKTEYATLVEHLLELEELGFLVEDFGEGTVIVREAPAVLDGRDIAYLLSEIAEKFAAHRHDLTPDALSSLYYSIAWKSAIRGGDITSREELAELIRKLEQNPQITHCPHGRPVSVKLSRSEIEKLFGRLG